MYNLLNTNVLECMKMDGMTDEKIREFTDGIVSRVEDEDGNTEGTIMDVEIFGSLTDMEKEPSLKMGRIEFPVPVVNPDSFLGNSPVLPGILGMDVREIEKIVFRAARVVIDPGTSGYAAKYVLSPAEDNSGEWQDSGAVTAYGGEAIEMLLKKEGHSTDGIILHTLPVIPVWFRFMKMKDGTYAPLPINHAYNRVIMRAERLSKLLGMGAPLIILRNEERILQEMVTTIIDNGVWVHADTFTTDLYPVYSLKEYAVRYSGGKVMGRKPVCSSHIDAARFAEALKNAGRIADSFNGNELTDIEEVPGYDEIAEELGDTVGSFVRAYIMESHPRCIGFADMATHYAISRMDRMIGSSDRGIYLEWAENGELGNLENGLMMQVEFFINKRARWAEE